jgi:hypothetical protein
MMFVFFWGGLYLVKSDANGVEDILCTLATSMMRSASM